MLFTIGVFAFVLFAFWKHYKAHCFWSDRSVPGPKPLPLFGNVLEMLTMDRPQINLKWERKYGPIVGYYLGTKPMLLINDPELTKSVLITDFIHFRNRINLRSYHEMWNCNLLFADDDNWRRLRQISSPVFTLRKLKLMQGLMNRCINNLVEHLDEIVHHQDGLIEDAKKVCNGFTLDVIFASCFATEVNANNPQEGGIAVLENARELFNISRLRTLAAFCLPSRLLYLLGIKTFFHEQPFEFFVQLAQEILRQRKNDPQKAQNDLVQLLMEAKAEDSTEGESTFKGKTLSESEIIAQCILFFIGGFETTALTLFHAIYELAQNASVQERLYQSIVEATGKGPDEESSEYFDIVINRLPYLDAVIKELLRKYPPVHMMYRRVKTDGYILAGVSLPKDVFIEFSSYTCHYNSAFYPDPQRFDPNRFLSPNIGQQENTAPYLPFGAGPKACIGKRFALQELKLCLAKLVRRYTFEPTERTAKCLTFSKILPLLATNTTPVKALIR